MTKFIKLSEVKDRVYETCQDILKRTLNLEAEASEGKHEINGQEYSAAMKIDGSINGVVQIKYGEAIGIEIAKTMLMTEGEIPEEELVSSVTLSMAELCNIIAGNLTILFEEMKVDINISLFEQKFDINTLDKNYRQIVFNFILNNNLIQVILFIDGIFRKP
ncbi:MAG: chemotaxis protein CheX [Leptospiraceae bacterium]|nr:chemotaxis protein CheX [Leptospiraceae bacterium]MCP5492990.1 chemotaxis protein CheX [Leptospiraceae bacterium]